MSEDFMLRTCLQASVPLFIGELARLDEQSRACRMEAWRADGIAQVCERGDILQFRGGKKGQTAEAFNALARGLAVLAHAPGGVSAFGEHWCTSSPHPPVPCPKPQARPVHTVTAAGGVL